MSKTLPEKDTPERSAETRARLVDAALDLFGAEGFAATSTRALVARAGVNLAAIPYYFGGKSGLYRAVVEQIAREIGRRIAEASAGAEARPRDPRASLHALLENVADILIAAPEAERWARVVMREQVNPTPAFAILYEGVMKPLHERLTGLVGEFRGEAPESVAVRLRAFTLLGQILAFRAARAAVLRRLDWTAIGPAELAQIKRVIHENVDAILAAGSRT